jgi:hypothetical protein
VNPAQVQVLISVLTIAGSGLSVYVGVRVAIAEMRRDIRSHDKQLDEVRERIERLEKPYFFRRPREAD